ncbi:MAG: hypothetical protein LUC27_02900 [Lachnospiraceae bacterium]|nr:hypothetical protein [Lachnospiraceae bacterium]
MTDLSEARKKAWSIENMAAHGAENREVKYLGTERKNGITYDYYRDEAGDYWYRSDAGHGLPNRTLTRKRKRLA